jgi:hypothetical protein
MGYVCFIVDVFARRIGGWRVAANTLHAQRLGMRRGMTPGQGNTEQHQVDRKCYLSRRFAITMRWIWLVPS